MLSYSGAEGTTENTVLGPFYAAGSPDRANGESMLDDDDAGDKVVVRGTVTNADGKPLEGVVLDCWQSNTDGWYTVQKADGQSEFNLRGIYHTDADGKYEIRTVRPGKYPIPHDGPVGAAAEGQQPRLDAARSPPHVGQAPRVQGTDHPHLRPHQRPPLRRRRVRRPREPDRRLHTRRQRRAVCHLRLRARSAS